MDLVVGRGLIGTGLYAYLRKFGEVQICGHLDVPNSRFDTVYLCSGITKTADCENNPESYKANVEFPISISKKFNNCIWLSSERVFDGSVPYPSELCPNTEYGRQKAEVEQTLKGSVGILRVAKVIGFNVPLFEGWIEDLRKFKVIHPFNNLSMAPSSLGYVCEILRRMGTGKMRGIYQLSGDRDISYDALASYFCLKMGRPLDLVQPLPSDKPHPNSVLKSDFESEESWKVIDDWTRNKVLG